MLLSVLSRLYTNNGAAILQHVFFFFFFFFWLSTILQHVRCAGVIVHWSIIYIQYFSDMLANQH
jgi:hypothetical protein